MILAMITNIDIMMKVMTSTMSTTMMAMASTKTPGIRIMKAIPVTIIMCIMHI